MLEGFAIGQCCCRDRSMCWKVLPKVSVVAKTGRCAGRFYLRSVLLARQVDVLEGFT